MLDFSATKSLRLKEGFLETMTQDMERQQLNVFRMRLLGAEVREVAAGTATLKDATSEAIRDWVTNVETTHYILGSAAGPHPYPMMVCLHHFATFGYLETTQ